MNRPFAEVLKYNRWATLALLESCRGLTDEQLDARVDGVSGTVRELLMHVVGGQQTQVLRTMGRQHEDELRRDGSWPGFDTLIDLARESADLLVAIAEALDEDSDVALAYMRRVFVFPKSFFLVHAAVHGVEHRTEIKVALARLGVETPDLDGWPYSASAGYGHEIKSAD